MKKSAKNLYHAFCNLRPAMARAKRFAQANKAYSLAKGRKNRDARFGSLAPLF